MNGASLHSLVLQNLRPRYQCNWYHPHFLLHGAHLGSEMRSPRGMRRGSMLRHDLLPNYDSPLLYRRSLRRASVRCQPRSYAQSLPCCPSAPWHTGREAQINSRTLTAVFSQVLGDLKTKEEVLNLFQTSSC